MSDKNHDDQPPYVMADLASKFRFAKMGFVQPSLTCNCLRNIPYLDWSHDKNCPLYEPLIDTPKQG